ncbi:MAG: 16S rRNA (guanine(527)-N(7))-methyltransferase RsmG [Rikenellaceae bacterium]|nr:16S rRNA (guanine(527)-N(7))-methyltransferase RsmG [Rikenellaceae bacterium]
MDVILKYFKNLTPEQVRRFTEMHELYTDWNSKINLISRKDIEELYVKHILHSLAIAKVLDFRPGTRVLDVGTGGGFPGIPLAVMFPEAQFTLVDSIGKKINVVKDIAEKLELSNVRALNVRAEDINGNFDFAVSRAVTEMPKFIKWVWNKIIPKGQNALPNGILYLKGGDLKEELKAVNKPYIIYDINEFFEEEVFDTKKIVYYQK